MRWGNISPLPFGERAGVRGRVRDAEGVPKGRSRRGRDGALRTPQQPGPERSEGTRPKDKLQNTFWCDCMSFPQPVTSQKGAIVYPGLFPQAIHESLSEQAKAFL